MKKIILMTLISILFSTILATSVKACDSYYYDTCGSYYTGGYNNYYSYYNSYSGYNYAPFQPETLYSKYTYDYLFYPYPYYQSSYHPQYSYSDYYYTPSYQSNYNFYSHSSAMPAPSYPVDDYYSVQSNYVFGGQM